jgi:hypothetical protein
MMTYANAVMTLNGKWNNVLAWKNGTGEMTMEIANNGKTV